MLRGHSFKERSDTEVVLKAYLEWGEECPKHFNGIFAFAVWDEINRTLFLARDRMGVKPLFYTEADGNFIFASEIKAILCHPSVKPEIDAEGISELFLIGPGRTPGFGIFRRIKELKPGHRASLSKENGLKIKPYWQLEARENRQTFEETVENVSYLVKDAIKRQTVSDVPLCSFLSGGLDSGAIAALSGVKHTFSVDYDDNSKYFKRSAFQPDSDEKYIRIMTDFLGTEHTNIVVGIDELTDALFDAAEARDLPGMADVDSSLLLFCRSVKQYATVALSGECADETEHASLQIGLKTYI
jgi:asparagine synthase (glutamine-hydrolysing)